MATHQFADVAQQRQQQFCKLPGIAPRECESLRRPHFRIRGEITIILRFERRVCRWESCRMRHYFIGALAQQKRRPAQDGKVEGANPSRATSLAAPHPQLP